MVDRNAPDWEPEFETAVAGPPNLAKATPSEVSELFSSEKYEVPKHVARRALDTMEGNDPYKLGASIFRIALEADDLPELSTPTRNFRWRQRVVHKQPPPPPPPLSRATNAERTKAFNAVYAAQQILRQLEQKMEAVKERIRSLENEESLLGVRLQEEEDVARVRLEEAERVHKEHLQREEVLSRAKLEEAERAQMEKIHHKEEQMRARLANVEPALKERSKQLKLAETMLKAKLQAVHDGKACPSMLGAAEALYAIEKARLVSTEKARVVCTKKELKQAEEKEDVNGILAAMAQYPDSVEVQETGCRALWRVVVKNNATRPTIAEKGGIEAAFHAMTQHSHHEGVQVQGCYMMCEMVKCESARPAIRKGKAVMDAARNNFPNNDNIIQYLNYVERRLYNNCGIQ
jgi:hypothetical protein